MIFIYIMSFINVNLHVVCIVTMTLAALVNMVIEGTLPLFKVLYH